MNAVLLIGNLTKDVREVKTPSGLTVALGTIALNRQYNGKKFTDFVPFKVVGREKLTPHLKKGKKIGLIGRLQSYRDKKGQDRLIVVAERIEFLSAKSIVSVPPQEQEEDITEEPF